MRPRISEFSYGYAVMEEISRRYRHIFISAPVFPSLYREGRSGGGYDVRINRAIGFPLFLQFKLSHLMVRGNAREIIHLGIFSSPPLLRMYLRKRNKSRQHELLCSLDNGENEVYYIAPYFFTQNELNLHYTYGRVIGNSYKIRPSAIGLLPDDDEHYIAIEPYSSFGFFLSDMEKALKVSFTVNFDEQLEQRLKKADKEIGELVGLLIEDMIAILMKCKITKKGIDLIKKAQGKMKEISLLYFLSRFYFGSELIFIIKEFK